MNTRQRIQSVLIAGGLLCGLATLVRAQEDIEYIPKGGAAAGGGGTCPNASAGQVLFQSGTDCAGDADLTFATDTLTATKAVVSTSATITANGVVAIGTNGGMISQQTAGTPDQSGLWTGTTNNSWVIAEAADKAFDFAHAAQANPTLFVHSANQNTTQWISLTHDGTNGIINAGTGSVLVSNALQLTAAPLADPTTANACSYGGTGFVCEGSGADANETTFTLVNPTADTTWEIPAFTAATYELVGSAGLLTSTRVPFANSAGALVDDSDMVFATDTLTVTKAVFPTSATLSDDAVLSLGTTAGNTNAAIQWNTTQTPDTAMLLTGSTSNAWIVAERADAGYDYGHAQQSDPTIFIQSSAQTANRWMSFSYPQADGVGVIRTGNGGVMFQLNGSSSSLAGIGSEGSLRSQSTATIGFVSGLDASAGNDAFWTRQAAAVLQQGADAGTAVAQTYKGPDSTTSGVAGATLTVAAGDGTVGNANGGDLILSGGAKAGTGIVGGVGFNASWLKNQQAEASLNADYTNATASFTSTALSVTVVSGQTYRVQAVIFLANTIAADGAQLDFNGGSATATNFRMHCVLDDTTTTIQDSAQISALATAFAKATLSGTGQHEWACNGTFVPSASGTFIVRGSKNSNTTGTLTFNRGSWLSVVNSRAL